jgi:hypothetical protein
MKGWPLTAARRRHLERELALTHDVAVFRRVLALLEMDAGRPLDEVARQLRVSPRSLYRWIERYRTHASVEGLHHQPGQGRPRHWDEMLEALLPSVLERFWLLGHGWDRPAAAAGVGPGSARVHLGSWPDAGPLDPPACLDHHRSVLTP